MDEENPIGNCVFVPPPQTDLIRNLSVQAARAFTMMDTYFIR